MTRLRTVGAGTLLGALVLVGLPVGAWAQPVTDYQMPFPCGQEWKGTTRSGHSPSPRSIDWNRADDDGDPVVASAPGVVTTAEASSTKGYGHHVVLDHGDGESTVYAHLDEVHVVEGQHVDQASQLGTVGSTGNSTGPHLHYEQRLDRKDVEAWFDGAAFVYGSTQRSANCVDVPMAANMIGTPAAELVVYRRAKRSQFLVQRAGKAPKRMRLGTASDEPVLGDWDGDGLWEVGVRTPATGTWRLRGADGSLRSVVLGDAGDIPVTGDWDGDGRTDLGVFDPTTATFTLRREDGDGLVWTAQVQFGQPGDLPVAGDWDGNATTEVGVWTPATATFSERRAASATAARERTAARTFGRPR